MKSSSLKFWYFQCTKIPRLRIDIFEKILIYWHQPNLIGDSSYVVTLCILIVLKTLKEINMAFIPYESQVSYLILSEYCPNLFRVLLNAIVGSILCIVCSGLFFGCSSSCQYILLRVRATCYWYWGMKIAAVFKIMKMAAC